MPSSQNSKTTGHKLPVSVLVVIYTAEDEVLMLRRRQPMDFWQSVTGSLQETESPREAACREVFEETGLDASDRIENCDRQNRFPIVEPWKKRYAPEETHNTEHVFRLKLERREEIKLNPEEHAESTWLYREKAAELASSYTNSAAILELTP